MPSGTSPLKFDFELLIDLRCKQCDLSLTNIITLKSSVSKINPA